MCQVISIWYETHQFLTQTSMILPPHWLSCLLASALPESIWKPEMLETCLEKPVFRVSVDQNYQQDQMVIENIFRLVSSIKEWQIGNTKVFWDSFVLGWNAITWKPFLSTNVLLNCGQGKLVPTFFSRFPPVGGSMLISAVCCFFLFFGNSESAMIGWQCLFCGASIAAWNALDVITVELYPTDKRCSECFSFILYLLTLASQFLMGKSTHTLDTCVWEKCGGLIFTSP